VRMTIAGPFLAPEESGVALAGAVSSVSELALPSSYGLDDSFGEDERMPAAGARRLRGAAGAARNRYAYFLPSKPYPRVVCLKGRPYFSFIY